MYCPKCNCEYVGWREKCPVCRTNLLDAKPKTPEETPKPLPYADLLEKIREHDGSLTIEMVATEIEMKRGRAFPYIGRGYAWTKHLQGFCDSCSAELTISQIGRDRKRTFPYFGFGFAWEEEMQGSVSENALTLKAEKVARDQEMEIPYRGYGYAWAVEMSGKCGDRLNARLTVTEVRRRKERGFPYFGFGFAWPNAGQLTLTLVD